GSDHQNVVNVRLEPGDRHLSSGAGSEAQRGIADDPDGEQADQQVGHGDRDQAGPRPAQVMDVQPGRALPGPVAQEGAAAAGEAVHLAADHVAEGVARQRVTGQQGDVEEHQRPDDPDPPDPLLAKREERVEPQEEEWDERQVQEVAVDVLENEREGGFEAVPAVDGRLPDSARRWIDETPGSRPYGSS